MLIADKQNLETSLRVRMLQIRERELDFFMQNMRNVAQVSPATPSHCRVTRLSPAIAPPFDLSSLPSVIAQLSTLMMGFAMSGVVNTKYIDQNLCGEREVRAVTAREHQWRRP